MRIKSQSTLHKKLNNEYRHGVKGLWCNLHLFVACTQSSDRTALFVTCDLLSTPSPFLLSMVATRQKNKNAHPGVPDLPSPKQ